MAARQNKRMSGGGSSSFFSLKFLSIVLLILLLGVSHCDACVFSVDLGHESLKVSLVKPGRTPIAIVSNEFSKRKSPALVGFSPQGDLLLGEDANAVITRFPERIFNRVMATVGIKHDSALLAKTLEQHRLPYKVVPDPNGRETAAFEMADGSVLIAEEILAQILKYADRIAEAQANSVCKDAVLIIPGYWGINQRLALLDAARLADITVLALVSDHASAALQYGIDKEFTNATQNVIFYDMGADSVKASYAHFSTFKTKELGKTKHNGQLEVKDLRYIDGIGGATLDMVLVEHFIKEFKEKHGKDISNVPRAVAKLKKACKKTKEILSANNDAPVSVEGLHDDIDFRSSIKRNAFVKLAGDFFEKAAAPLKELVDANGGTNDTAVTVVELIGGGTRVPELQSYLEKVFKGAKRETPVLGRHMDGDESVALGAALHAANMSTSFRMRKFGFSDTAMFEMQLTTDVEPVMKAPKKGEEATEAATTTGENEDGTWTKTVLPAFKRLPSRRFLTFPNVTVDAINMLMHYGRKASSLPTGVDASLANTSAFGGTDIARFDVSSIQNLTASTDKYNVTSLPKVSVTLQFDTSGMFFVEKAEASFDTEYIAKVRVPIIRNETVNATDAADANATDDNATDTTAEDDDVVAADADNATDVNATTDDNATDANATKAKKAKKPKKPKPPPIEYETVEKLKTRRMTVQLDVSNLYYTYPSLSQKQFGEAYKRLKDIDKREAAKKRREAAKNTLETFILSAGGKLADEEVELVSTEETREDVRAQLMDAEDWLYGDGDSVEADVYDAKQAELKNLTEPIMLRASELTARPEAMKKALAFVEETRTKLEKMPTLKPYLKPEEIKVATDELEAYEKYLADMDEKQNALKPTDELVLTSKMIYKRGQQLSKEMKLLNERKAPPPPPKPKADKKKKNATNVNATDANATEAEADSAESTESESEGGGEEKVEDGEPEAKEADGDAAADDADASSEKAGEKTTTHDGDELKRKRN